MMGAILFFSFRPRKTLQLDDTLGLYTTYIISSAQDARETRSSAHPQPREDIQLIRECNHLPQRAASRSMGK